MKNKMTAKTLYGTLYDTLYALKLDTGNKKNISSLGGARPKANMQDETEGVDIAKVSSVHNEYDMALWEHFTRLPAQRAERLCGNGERLLTSAIPIPLNNNALPDDLTC